MAKARVITYECEECGSEIVVTPEEGMELSPIYCCGVQVTEVMEEAAPVAKPKAKPKAAKKPAAKKPTPKKPAAKKKAGKK
jgi:hypothetical protein